MDCGETSAPCCQQSWLVKWERLTTSQSHDVSPLPENQLSYVALAKIPFVPLNYGGVTLIAWPKCNLRHKRKFETHLVTFYSSLENGEKNSLGQGANSGKIGP